MQRLIELYKKEEKLVVGLMSGTSVDGIDAALVRIKGNGIKTKAKLIAFKNFVYPDNLRKGIFELFEEETSNSSKICEMNFVLGEYFAKAVLDLCELAQVKIEQVDLIGSHGQTIYHQSQEKTLYEYPIKSTLQIGESAVIAERTGVVTVSDFRVRDMAAYGLGAPLVPYTEYLLYRSETECIGLQNIGGIGNLTVIPPSCKLEDVYAFDTGPGNMIIDAVVSALTQGRLSYDQDGNMAAGGLVHEGILHQLLEHQYFKQQPPKTTGREDFGKAYAKAFLNLCETYNLSVEDKVATATALTAKSIAIATTSFTEKPLTKCIVGGGGSYNKTLLKMLTRYMKIPVLTQEDIGFNSDAKEAIAFAVLANETICGNANNLPRVTGAIKPVVLGKLSV